MFSSGDNPCHEIHSGRSVLDVPCLLSTAGRQLRRRCRIMYGIKSGDLARTNPSKVNVLPGESLCEDQHTLVSHESGSATTTPSNGRLSARVPEDAARCCCSRPTNRLVLLRTSASARPASSAISSSLDSGFSNDGGSNYDIKQTLVVLERKSRTFRVADLTKGTAAPSAFSLLVLPHKKF